MSEQSIKIGDVVRLASGGPLMTVWGLRPDGFIDVCWFRERQLLRDAFERRELRQCAWWMNPFGLRAT